MPTKKHTQSRSWTTPATYVMLGLFAVVSSFTVGIKTAGEVHTVGSIGAMGTRISGDIDGNGIVEVRDAVEILEVARGYTVATPDELLADPNSDGHLTIDDAIRILNDLSIR